MLQLLASLWYIKTNIADSKWKIVLKIEKFYPSGLIFLQGGSESGLLMIKQGWYAIGPDFKLDLKNWTWKMATLLFYHLKYGQFTPFLSGWHYFRHHPGFLPFKHLCSKRHGFEWSIFRSPPYIDGCRAVVRINYSLVTPIKTFTILS